MPRGRELLLLSLAPIIWERSYIVTTESPSARLTPAQTVGMVIVIASVWLGSTRRVQNHAA